MIGCKSIAAIAGFILVGSALAACSSSDGGSSDSSGTGDDLTNGPLSGKTITLIMNTSVGGAMDFYGRFMGDKLGECIGASDVRYKNEKGAGGIIADNDLWKSKPDGTTLEFASLPGLILAEESGASGVNYHVKDLTFIGRVATEPRVLVVGSDTDIKSVDDLKNLKKSFVYPTQGPELDYFIMVMLSEKLGFPLGTPTGYTGLASQFLAIKRGTSTGLSTGVLSVQQQIDAGDVRPLVYIGEPGLTDFVEKHKIPSAVELSDNDPLVTLISNMIATHRSLFGPPDMSTDVVNQLRDGFECAMSDPDFQKKADETEHPLKPMSGTDLEKLVASLYTTSDADLKNFLTDALDRIK